MVKVPFVNLTAQTAEIKKEVFEKWDKVISSGEFILGSETLKFEKNFAKFCQTKFAKLVASGTDALYLSLIVSGIKPGDEVITTSFSFISTASSIIRLGAVPVFVDIIPETFNIDPAKIEAKITKKTKAIIPVHLFGQMANMPKILALATKYKLKVIEDAAQAHGAKLNGNAAGSFGDLAAFSFYPTKNLPSFSDCGAVVTNYKEYADHVAILRNHGFTKPYFAQEPGINSRSDELQAVWLQACLKRLPHWNKKRQRLAQRYVEKLSNLPITLPKISQGAEHVFHVFAIRTEKRDDLKKFLARKGMETQIYYPVPIHKQPAFAKLSKVNLPETERVASEILALPIYPQMSFTQQGYVCNTIYEFFKNKNF